MDLGNPIKIVVYHLLIEGTTCLDHQDEFPMMSALVYMMHIEQDLQWIMMQGYQSS